jgi:hypothetical protein
MFVQIAPRNTGSCNPENPIQNKAVVPRAPTAARTTLNYKRLKTVPFLVAHQTSNHGSLLKSHLESEITRVGNPLCQHNLGDGFPPASSMQFILSSCKPAEGRE